MLNSIQCVSHQSSSFGKALSLFALGLVFLITASFSRAEISTKDSIYQALNEGYDTSRAQAYQGFASMLYRQGHIDSSRAICKQGIAFIEGSRSDAKHMAKSMGKLYYSIGICYYREGKVDKTLGYLDTANGYFNSIGDTASIVSVIGVRGAVAEFRGQNDSALSRYETAYNFMVAKSNTSNQILYLNNMAGVYKRKQLYDQAAETYRRSLDLANRAGIVVSQARCFKGLGDIAYYQGLYNQALDNYNRSIPLYEKSGYFNGLNNALSNRALVYKAQKEYDAAMKTYRQNLAASMQMGKEKGIAEDYQLIGEIHELQGNLDSAIWYFQSSLKISERIGYPRGVANCQGVLARVYLEQGRISEAESLARSAVLSFHEQSNEYREWMATSILARVLLKAGRLDESQVLANKAYSKGVELSILSLQESSSRVLYEVLKRKQNYRDALSYLETADQLLDSLRSEELRESAIRSDLEYAYHQESLRDSIQSAQEKYQLNLSFTKEIEANKRREAITVSAVILILLIAIALLSRVRYIQKARKRLQKEKDRSDELLLNILPLEVADELKLHGESQARDFEQVTVLFTDFKEFTQKAESLTAKDLVNEINTCFKEFYRIMDEHGIEKIKTIGDSYMVAGGLHDPRRSEVKDVVLAGIKMQEFMVNRMKLRDKSGLPAFEMRVGIHTGPVVAGIVGVKKFQYDIWGDTVNTASRMESHGEVGKVNISNTSYQYVKDIPNLHFVSRGMLEVKGKGQLHMWFVSQE